VAWGAARCGRVLAAVRLTDLEQDFRPGFHLAPASGGKHVVLDRDGEPVRVEGGAPFHIPWGQCSSNHLLRRYRRELEKLGVIERVERRTSAMRHTPRAPKEGSGLSPLVAAREALRDERAGARERALAKTVLRLTESNEALGRLATELARQRDSAEAEIERRDGRVA
jgi:hypothetical protein